MSQPDKRFTDNERLIADIIRRNEPIVRSAISVQSPFSQPGVHRILDSLLDHQLIQVGEARANGPGKPSPEIRLDRSRHFSLGIDVNTDAIDVCLANVAGEPVATASIPGNPQDRSATLRATREHAIQMLTEQNRTEDDLVGVCLGVPGFFVEGGVNAPEPLRDWSLVDLHEALEEHFNAPTWVANNATTGAIGESLIGVGTDIRTFGYLSFNYGFGGGAIIDGKPYLGPNGNAFELSALYTDEEHPNRPALQYLIAELNKNNIDLQTINELRDTFDPSWPGVESWIERTMPQLNTALRAFFATFNPECIVFGGEIPEQLAAELIKRATIRGSEQHRYGVALTPPELIYTQAPQVGPALGAAMLPLKEQIYV